MKYQLRIFLNGLCFLILMGCSEEPVADSSFGRLTGKVVAKGDNTPLPNVKISSTPVSTTIFSDAEGNFSIDEVQVGEYAYQAELKDFKTAFESANILEGKTVNITFELDSLTLSNLMPATPLLLSPEDATENILANTEFAWTSAANDTDNITYTLELRDGSTNEIRLFEEINDTILQVEDLVIGKNYFWQVSADDGVNDPTKSAISGFSTKGNISNRFLYVKNIDNNNVIFSSSEPSDDTGEDMNFNELQLTASSTNSFRPIKSTTAGKIAFLRLVGAETHLFTMNLDGSAIEQVTNDIPVAGFRSSELEFSWYANGARLYYPNFNRLYSINPDGSGNRLEYQVASNMFISEIAVNPSNNLVAVKTNTADGYNASITIVNVGSDDITEVVAEDFDGALGGLDFSADGRRVLFTRDVSGAENTGYRPLDSRIFEFNSVTDTILEIETSKLAGTNDLDPKYSPDDGSIIFVNTSNDGISEKRIFRTQEDDQSDKELLFMDAFMPNWE